MMTTKSKKTTTYLIAYCLLFAVGLCGGHRMYLKKFRTGFVFLGLFIIFIVSVISIDPQSSELLVLMVGIIALALIIWWLVDLFSIPRLARDKLGLQTEARAVATTKLKKEKTPHRKCQTEYLEKLPMLPREFIVFDLETTGLSSYKNEIIEIGAIRINMGAVEHDSFQILVKPEGDLPREITKLTGITKKMLADGSTIQHALKEFVKFTGDLRLVAFNAPFDMDFLRVAAKPLNISIRNPVSDPLNMMRRAYPGLPSYKLRDLAKTMKLSTSRHHRALNDCMLTVQVYATAAEELNDCK